MSHTDKDQPDWLRNHDHGVIDHDHRTGDCIVETIADAARRAAGPLGWTHRRRCAKNVEVVDFCTKDDPHLGWRGVQDCWRAWREAVRDDAGCIVGFTWRSVQCAGHPRRVTDETIPCACDDVPPAPTCTPAWHYGRHYYRRRGVPRDVRHATWFGPERARVRDELRDAAREYNAYGDVEDGDVVNVQARGQARWWWL